MNLSFTGDMLGGHLDDMEADWSKPIVSIRYCFIEMVWYAKLLHSFYGVSRIFSSFFLGFSYSLGCKAIFLLGGKSREEPPVAMFLQSGDIVLMAGQARECFHGQYDIQLMYFVLIIH